MSQYITRKRFKGLAICGEVNLPYGTPCEGKDTYIYYNGKPLCRRTSQTAIDYFSIDDDGHGLERGKLVETIMDELRQGSNKHDEKWEAVQQDPIAETLRRQDHQDFWLWSYKFYEASMDDLNHIYDLIKGA